MLRLVVALGIALLLLSCSRASFLVLHNNSGSAVEIVSAPDLGNPGGIPRGNKTWSFPWTWRFLIENGEAREIASYNGESWYVQLRTRDCTLEYLVPDAFQNFGPHQEGLQPGPLHVRVQLEPDLRLHLVPYNVRSAMRVELLASYQPTGFPASAVTSCDGG